MMLIILTACSSLTTSSTKQLTIKNSTVPCAQVTIPQDLSHYLDKKDLDGILSPIDEATQIKDNVRNKQQFINDYHKLYNASHKQEVLFLKEYKISQEKTVIINNMNKCIKSYNNNIK